MGQVNMNVPERALEAKDLRRSRMEILRRRLELLNGADKVLMTMYVEKGSSFRQIARLRGVSEASVARRVHQLTQRLIDGEFLTCVRNRDRLTGRQMALARDAFLTGLSLRQIAEKRRVSIYAVRKELADIRKHTKETKLALSLR
jgi:predicted DNA-binding protein YlxM (UPF0122 family)